MTRFNYAAVGERIRYRRKALSLTQEQLSEMAEISTSFLGHIERGTRIASLETLVRIADALDTDLNALVSPRNRDTDKSERRLLAEILTLIADNTDLLERRHEHGK